MQTLLLKVEDSAMDKVMFLLEHLKDVVKTEKYTSLEDELLMDLEGLKANTSKTTPINDIKTHINNLRNEA